MKRAFAIAVMILLAIVSNGQGGKPAHAKDVSAVVSDTNETLSESFAQGCDEVCEEMFASLNSATGFEAKFVQESISGLGAKGITSEGKISISPEGMIKMIYQRPEEREVLINSQNIQVWNKAAQTLVAQRMPGETGHVSTENQLLLGLMMFWHLKKESILSNFEIHALHPAAGAPGGVEDTDASNPKSGKWRVLVFTPRSPNSFVSKWVVSLDEKWVVRRLILVDWAGNFIRMTFSGIQRVRTFPKRIFRLNVPKNTQTIRP